MMMNVAAKYEVPESKYPSNTKQVATVFIKRKRVNQSLCVEKMFTPNRSAPIIYIVAPVKAPSNRN